MYMVLYGRLDGDQKNKLANIKQIKYYKILCHEYIKVASHFRAIRIADEDLLAKN